MIFSNKNLLSDTFKNKSVVLVGSGPSVMDHRKGYIDSFDLVVRVNNYKIAAETGKRTDVFYSYFGSSIKKTSDELTRDGVLLCMNKCPNDKVIESKWHEQRRKMNGIDFRYIYEQRKDWWFCPTYSPVKEEFLKVFEMLGKHIPTTGFSALLDILQLNPSCVYMTGFDFFESKIHNVNEPWRKINHSDPIGHRPELEKEWLKNNLLNYPIQLDSRLKRVLR